MLTACKVVSAIRNGCYICYENRERAKFTARLKVCEKKKNFHINKKAIVYTYFKVLKSLLFILELNL